jgi:uncharacterized protein (DUF488 family)
MKYYTVGYGGRNPLEFADILKKRGIATVVDVRLRPDHSSMGAYVKARDCLKGIEGLLSRSGIEYIWLPELGNVFFGCEDWRERYEALFDVAGHLLTRRLLELKAPPCLLCAERDVAKCHRGIISDYLEKNGMEVEHIL